MKRIGWAVLAGIDKLNILSAYVVSVIILVLMLTIVYDVFMRYFFHAPTLWSYQLNSWLLLASAMLAGGYALFVDGHVRVDIFFRNFSIRKKAAVELIMFLLFFAFAGALLIGGLDMTLQAIKVGEKSSNTAVPWPMTPVYLTVPVGAGLILLQGLARYIRNMVALYTGEEQVKVSEVLGGEE